MTGLTDPVDRRLARALRAAALDLRDRRRGRRFPVEISVGGLGEPDDARAVLELPAQAETDHGLRVEVVSALLFRARHTDPEPIGWVARPGSLCWHDVDAAWLPAFVAAYAEARVPLGFVVVTKNGWYDPRSGLTREWKRLRRGRRTRSPGPT